MFLFSAPDVYIYCRISQWYNNALAKTEEDGGQPDDRIGSEKYPDHWAALCEKGYQGVMEFTRTVHPK